MLRDRIVFDNPLLSLFLCCVFLLLVYFLTATDKTRYHGVAESPAGADRCQISGIN